MYFVSCSSNLVVELDSEHSRMIDKQPNAPFRQRKTAQFRPAGGVPDYVREEAARMPGFYRGIGRDEDPFGRISYWDSFEAQRLNGWTDEEREEAEQALLASGDPDVILVEKPKLGAPWASYDAMHHSKVASFAVEAGMVAEALAYERENKARPSVIDALEAASATSEAAVAEDELVKA